MPKLPINQFVRREAILFLALLFTGLFLLPAAIYTVGQVVFGAYGGMGIADFYQGIFSRVGNGDGVAWFLILSLYIGLQSLRLTIRLFRRSRRDAIARSG